MTRISCVCALCGKQFERWPDGVRRVKNVFCSTRCAGLFNAPAKTTEDQFWSRVNRLGPDECWEWTGARQGNGYGNARWNRKAILAHRLALCLTDGQWDNKQLVCHTCDNRICCNPAHLWRGSHLDNTRDMDKKGRRRVTPSLGEAHWSSKLTAEQITEIRRSTMPSKELAAAYNVTKGHINQIKSRLLWRHLP